MSECEWSHVGDPVGGRICAWGCLPHNRIWYVLDARAERAMKAPENDPVLHAAVERWLESHHHERVSKVYSRATAVRRFRQHRRAVHSRRVAGSGRGHD